LIEVAEICQAFLRQFLGFVFTGITTRSGCEKPNDFPL